MRLTSGSIKPIADAIHAEGYAVVQTFLGADVVRALADECRDADLCVTAVGRGANRAEHTEIRGDKTRWLDDVDASAAVRTYFDAMNTLRVELNHALTLGLEELEAHFAMYAPGARYGRHRDRFRDDDARVLSSVLYLNDDWNESDGGALRLYLSDHHLDVYPSGGKLVLFLSADFDHEVLPATRDRFSIAGWFRRRA
ncbi:MAG TPA: 2OG-Fe(II) oxygenase [Rudaea sp.]|nr:2OG-Fe(II) oxygenase [Rudaea sp.]